MGDDDSRHDPKRKPRCGMAHGVSERARLVASHMSIEKQRKLIPSGRRRTEMNRAFKQRQAAAEFPAQYVGEADPRRGVGCVGVELQRPLGGSEGIFESFIKK